MKVPLWVRELARVFWQEAGMVEPFPRQLRQPIARAFQLILTSLPDLRLEVVRNWLLDNGVPCTWDEPDRPLRACLIVRGDCGAILLDGGDPADEQTFSLSHELAHFLRHHWQPRLAAADSVGAPFLEAFDGQRRPTLDERVHALLNRVPLDLHSHLLPRDLQGLPVTPAITQAEEDADRLAYELLAPADDVQRRLGARPESDLGLLGALLVRDFGLPPAEAARYARHLAPPPPRSDPLLRSLGLVH